MLWIPPYVRREPEPIKDGYYCFLNLKYRSKTLIVLKKAESEYIGLYSTLPRYSR